jgi:membrane dipeptidase
VDIPTNYATPDADPGIRGDMQVDLPKMVEGGLDAVFFVVFVPQTERTAENYQIAQAQAMNKFNAIHRMTDEQYPDRIELARTARDVSRIHNSGKRVALIGVENGYTIGKNLELIKDYYDLGARYMSLTHNGHNDLADSSAIRDELGDEEVEHGGVSKLGARVIEEMNKLGMMVDVAHAGKATVLDVASLSKAPIISSHHALKHFVDIPRNLDDEEMIAIKETGGVVQIVAYDSYLKPVHPDKAKAFAALMAEYGVDSPAAYNALSEADRQSIKDERARFDEQWSPASVQDFVDHIDYAVDLIGVDHVGIVSDFEGGGGITGWRDASETLNVTIELVRRGYSEKDIGKIWSGNLLRVMSDVERIARKQSAEKS